MSRDEFDKKVENIKLAMLITTAWKKPHSVSSGIMPAENLGLLRYVANSPGEEGNVATRGMLLENEAMLDQYILHVALQQSLMTRLLDEPGAELRSEDKKQEKSFKRRLARALFLLIILLSLLFVSSSKGSGAHNEVKRLAYSVIPEPSSVGMLAVGLGALLIRGLS